MRRWFLFVLGILWFQNPAGAQDALTPSQFTQECFELFRAAARPREKVEIARALSLKFTFSDGRWSTINLDNLYANHRRDPGAKRQMIAEYVMATLKAYAEVDAPIEKARILAVLRPRAFLEAMTDKPGGALGWGVVFEWLNADIAIVYVEDRPTAMRFFKPDDLRTIRLPRRHLRALALANLRAKFSKIRFEREGGVYAIVADGNYESSLLLLPEIWTAENFPVKGELVVAVPTRDRVLVAGSDDKRALARMREDAEAEFAAGPYGVSPKLFRYSAGTLVEFAR